MTFLKNYKVAGESTRCATSTSTTAPLLRRSLNIFVHITLRIREPSLPPWPALATLTYVDPASAKASREKFTLRRPEEDLFRAQCTEDLIL